MGVNGHDVSENTVGMNEKGAQVFGMLTLRTTQQGRKGLPVCPQTHTPYPSARLLQGTLEPFTIESKVAWLFSFYPFTRSSTDHPGQDRNEGLAI